MNSNGKRVKIMLMERDISQAQIARDLGISRAAVYGSVFDFPRKRSLRIQRHIAQLLGKDVCELWPGTQRRKHKKI